MDGPRAKSRLSMEEWRPIHQKPDYEVSSWGRVRHGDRILIPTLRGDTRAKYYELKLGRGKTYRIHRLVAETFLSNPEDKLQVDHIDCDKLNNCVDNLRWVTMKENGMNRGAQSNNKLGEKNIRWDKDRQKYRVEIRKKTIGRYSTLEEAIEARNNFLKE